ncbi:hypothetical protein [Thermohalobacter berrensis]|nr:hypothetical protein [Thermohalobacter berrensis]
MRKENLGRVKADYLLFFFLVLTEIWNAKYEKNNLLFFYLILTTYT